MTANLKDGQSGEAAQRESVAPPSADRFEAMRHALEHRYGSLIRANSQWRRWSALMLAYNDRDRPDNWHDTVFDILRLMILVAHVDRFSVFEELATAKRILPATIDAIRDLFNGKAPEDVARDLESWDATKFAEEVQNDARFWVWRRVIDRLEVDKRIMNAMRETVAAAQDPDFRVTAASENGKVRETPELDSIPSTSAPPTKNDESNSPEVLQRRDDGQEPFAKTPAKRAKKTPGPEENRFLKQLRDAKGGFVRLPGDTWIVQRLRSRGHEIESAMVAKRTDPDIKHTKNSYRLLRDAEA